MKGDLSSTGASREILHQPPRVNAPSAAQLSHRQRARSDRVEELYHRPAQKTIGMGTNDTVKVPAMSRATKQNREPPDGRRPSRHHNSARQRAPMPFFILAFLTSLVTTLSWAQS
jgi:hypothetical protein